jgi:hypothetical protein
MTLSSVSDQESRSASASPATPIVFVVDDDISVRESLELLIRRLAAGDIRVRARLPVSPASPRSKLPDT